MVSVISVYQSEFSRETDKQDTCMQNGFWGMDSHNYRCQRAQDKKSLRWRIRKVITAIQSESGSFRTGKPKAGTRHTAHTPRNLQCWFPTPEGWHALEKKDEADFPFFCFLLPYDFLLIEAHWAAISTLRMETPPPVNWPTHQSFREIHPEIMSLQLCCYPLIYSNFSKQADP